MDTEQMRRTIVSHLDERISTLKKHRFDQITVTGNQYDELNQALSKVIGVPIMEELEDIKSFVSSL